MNYLMNRILKFSLATGLVIAHAVVSAQGYPDKAIKVTMPWLDGFPANSTRLFSEKLAQLYKRPVVVDVKSGAGGEVAARQVLQAHPDGYSLLSTGSSITIRSVTDASSVDPEREFVPIAQLVTTPYVIVAKRGKFGSFKNFLAAAKANPGKINFASAGVGTGMHYLGELINANSGVRIVHVPYASGSRQLQAVLSDDVHVAIISLVTALPYIKSDTMEALAVSSPKRSKVAPHVPTLLESGVEGVPDIGAWIAMFAPRGTDPAVVQNLSEKIMAIASDPAVAETVASWGAEIPDVSPAHLSEVIQAERKTWTQLIKEKHLVTGNK